MDREELTRAIRIAAQESFSRSGGPGGQNVNKLNTHVTLRVAIATIGLPPDQVETVLSRLANRINANGELVLHSSETRSQSANRERAIERAVELVEHARYPGRTRKPTRPSKAARDRRLQQKKYQAIRKERRRITPDD